MLDVLSFGEAIIDFVPTTSGVSLLEAKAFKKAPGGAPANVAVGLARLGFRAGFMGMVGDDAFGHFLADTLVANGVIIDGLYRHPSADMLMSPQDVDVNLIQSATIFHLGSITLIYEPSRSATLFALDAAQKAGIMISYDPNLRLNLWPGVNEARDWILSILDHSQVIKISDEELEFLTGVADLKEGARKLWRDNLKILVVTCGPKGAVCFMKENSLYVPGYKVNPLDTTGAGDGFVAGLLAGLVKQPNAMRDPQVLMDIGRQANAVGALTTTRRGAIPALPTIDEVHRFQKYI
jgi:fructokinase